MWRSSGGFSNRGRGAWLPLGAGRADFGSLSHRRRSWPGCRWTRHSSGCLLGSSICLIPFSLGPALSLFCTARSRVRGVPVDTHDLMDTGRGGGPGWAGRKWRASSRPIAVKHRGPTENAQLPVLDHAGHLRLREKDPTSCINGHAKFRSRWMLRPAFWAADATPCSRCFAKASEIVEPAFSAVPPEMRLSKPLPD
jgi:hypothetical protein